MARGRKRNQQAEKILYRSLYLMELARGSSHIASTLSVESRQSAIAEVLDEFSDQHGADKLLLFRELLAESLEKRDHRSAAQAVLRFELPGLEREDVRSHASSDESRTR